MENVIFHNKTSVPIERRFNGYSRRRIQDLLLSMQRHSLIAVVGGTGYGKTQAVAEFMRTQKNKCLWLNLTRRECFTKHFWGIFTFAVGRLDALCAERLKQLGLPGTEETLAAFLQILTAFVRRQAVDCPVFLVLDDFDLIQESGPAWLIQQVVAAGIEGLTIVALSRQDMEWLALSSWGERQGCVLTQVDLALNEEEIAGLFRWRDLTLKAEDVEKLAQYTQGWPVAVNAIANYMAQGVHTLEEAMKLTQNDVAEILVEDFQMWSPEARDLFVQISFAASFPLALLEELSGGVCDRRAVERICRRTPFIKLIWAEDRLEIDNLYLLFLRQMGGWYTDEQVNTLQRWLGGWFEQREEWMAALTHYAAGDDYHRLLWLLEREAVFSRNDPALTERILSCLDGVPASLLTGSPGARLLQAFLFFLSGRKAEAERRAQEIVWECAAGLENEGTKEVLAEAALLLGFLGSHDLQAMRAFFARSRGFCSGRLSHLSDSLSEPAFLYFGQPSPLFHCYRQEGLAELQGLFSETASLWREITASAARPEDLVAAEICYERGDWRSLQTLLNEAGWAAEVQIETKAGAKSLAWSFFGLRVGLAGQLRLETQAYACAPEDLLRRIEALLDPAEVFSAVALNRDLILGWYYGKIGLPERAPAWLAQGRFQETPWPGTDCGLEQLIYIECLFWRKEYHHLETILEILAEVYVRQKSCLGRLRILIYRAILAYHAHKVEAAADYLEQAAVWAAPERLVMPFVEMACHLLPLVKRLRRDKAFDPLWLNSMYRSMSAYQRNIEKARARQEGRPNKENGLLSRQETAVLRALLKGLSSQKIAYEQGISYTTLRSITSNIYNKLGVDSRAELVKYVWQKKIL